MPEKEIMSKAERRRLKKNLPVVSPEEKEENKKALKDMRKDMKILKSNGGRKKFLKLESERIAEKRQRELTGDAELDEHDDRPITRGRRVEQPSDLKKK
jgi:hypothetical protein